MLNKSSLTTVLSLLPVGISPFLPAFKEEALNMGLFATSGALTNWLAVHMLFEKVPLLYGSGVIPSRFLEFKAGIKTLVMEQFFTEENIQKFLGSGEAKGPDLESLLEKVDLDKIFDGFLETVETSQFGPMLAMFGGASALAPLRGPFQEKMKGALLETVQGPGFASALKAELGGGDLLSKVEGIVEKRLDELTPETVKEIIQKMIREHLGWLVVWGGVFGGLLGLLAALVL